MESNSNNASNQGSVEKIPAKDSILPVHTQEYDLAVSRSTPMAMTEGHRLKKDLQSRHITMIAIGGAVGTGLLIGTASSISTAGGGATFVAYSIVGIVVFFVMAALGEMASFIPLPDGFPGYSSRYVDPAMGFAVGYSYLCKYLIVTPNQLVAGSLVMQYWVSPEKVNPGVWIAILLVVVLLVNYFGVKFFGEFEFWLSSIKVVTILGLIILLFIIMLGGGPSHDRLGFRYWTDPGAFKPYKHIEPPSKGKFVAFWAVFVYAVFAYLGTELVGVTFGEARNPRHSIKKAIKLTFYRILVFYCASCFLLACCVAYNDPLLLSAKGTSAAASPFVIAIKNAKISVLPHVVNACILIFIFSASNSDLYIATRTLYGLSANGKAPKIFSRTNKNGVPVYSLAFAGLFCCLAFMTCSSSSKTVFNYFVNVVSIFGLLTWISILVTYIFFTRAVKAQGYVRTRDFVYYAPLQPYGTYFSLFMCCMIAIIKNFTVFIGGFDYKSFVTGYIGIPVYFICFIGYKIIKKSKFIKPEEADLFTYKDVIDAEEKECLREEEEMAKLKINGKKDWQWFYDKFIGWLF
ncbi:Dip5 protein [Saccharomycopsis crataegensis]|uniref:Dip5 protein n=1 Tax=Saccharomycopsis crataegensis TaxID=43959 RepID=A0AAV5QRR6_9ASCO|nr:Dip5 protein [Saccharomycopsis crataegensis]